VAKGDCGFWNYRVVAHREGDGFYFLIHEAYYDSSERGKRNPIPESLTTEAVKVGSETGDGLLTVLEMMNRATTMPPIDYRTMQPIGRRAAAFLNDRNFKPYRAAAAKGEQANG
jgi:hypothetical protein